ncbi:MAG: class I SAM-dependent methyltransferase [Thermoleophilia bacterium]|nr:class I SAM-dependent methyltransferase [Thermoleophilia bacterium]
MRERVRERAPNLSTAAWLYLFLRAQQRRYARAGADPRPPRELVEASPNGAVLRLRDHELADLRFQLGELAASQKLDEIAAFLDRVAAIRPRAVCEIGSAAGGTLYLLTRVAADDAVLVSIDVDLPAHVAAARRRLARADQRVVGIQGDSHAPATVDRLRAALAGRPLDVLFIDGDHSYAGVRGDWERYAPLVRPGGVIGLHDVHEDYTTSRGAVTAAISGDVPRFWRELGAGLRTEELVADPEQDGYGIGVVYP